ncbi:MAG: c-type cytochrome [Bdellovibrionales bacterium]|nr:c-type cytochrome [Bdellovibrionales bacterium]
MSDSKQEPGFDVPLSDHEYDGIQEFNNPAPFWWQLAFYLSIVFAIGYYAYYEIGMGESSDQRITEAMYKIKQIQNANKPQGPDEKELNAMLAQAESVDAGKEVFISKCAACHAPDGGGLVGPNLTDQYWLHGKGGISDIYKVVRDGVADKGMPPWGPILKETELKSVVVFVKSLEGRKPAAPKAPQGVDVTQEK